MSVYPIGNSFGIVTIIILLISGLVFQRYLPGAIGFQLQMYFFPASNVASKILMVFFKNITSNGIFGTSFLLMVLVYYIGYTIGRKKFAQVSLKEFKNIFSHRITKPSIAPFEIQ